MTHAEAVVFAAQTNKRLGDDGPFKPSKLVDAGLRGEMKAVRYIRHTQLRHAELAARSHVTVS